jgi:hypothetical protein
LKTYGFVSAEEPLVPSKIVAKMDVISAMEAVEDASGKHNARKKTPPGSGSQVKLLLQVQNCIYY